MKKKSLVFQIAAVLCFSFFWVSSRGIAAGLLSYEVEPIIGYERIVKLIPTKHSRDRLIYGARLRLGVLMISGEAEYTKGTDTENFSSPTLTVKDTADKAKLGLRSTFRLFGIMYLFTRAGAAAQKNIHEETSGGVTTKTTEPIYIKPYAGAGFRARLGHNFRFDADMTVIFVDIKTFKDFEYQATAGFAIEFP